MFQACTILLVAITVSNPPPNNQTKIDQRMLPRMSSHHLCPESWHRAHLRPTRISPSNQGVIPYRSFCELTDTFQWPNYNSDDFVPNKLGGSAWGAVNGIVLQKRTSVGRWQMVTCDVTVAVVRIRSRSFCFESSVNGRYRARAYWTSALALVSSTWSWQTVV